MGQQTYTSTQNEKTEAVEALENYPNYLRNPLCVRNAVEHAPDGQASGWKPLFDWITEEDTICGEWFNGRHVILKDFHTSLVGPAIMSRRDHYHMRHHPWMWHAVMLHMANGRFDHMNVSEIPGTMVRCHPQAPAPWQFVSRAEQITKYRYRQWDNGVKSLDSVQLWLYEDLATHIPRSEEQHKVYHNGHKVPAPHRPDGLMFVNERLQVMGRIRLEDCTWWRIMHNTELSRTERGKALGIELERLRK